MLAVVLPDYGNLPPKEHFGGLLCLMEKQD
jgi:hypothetical protein